MVMIETSYYPLEYQDLLKVIIMDTFSSLKFTFLNPNECFMQARVVDSGITTALCASRVIILVFMIILLIAVLVLLHLQLSHKGWFNRSTYRSLKNWLLILITLYAMDNVVRYIFLI